MFSGISEKMPSDINPRNRNLECFTISKTNPLTINYFRSHVAIDNEKERHLENFPYTIHPLSKFCEYYSAYCFFLYVTLIVLKSYDFAFTRIKCEDPYSKNIGILATGITFDCLAILNMILQCFIGYAQKDLNIELSLQKILLRNFLSGHIFCDLFSSIPRIAMIRTHTYTFFILNTMQLLKLRRITSIVRLIRPTFQLLKIKSPVKKFVIVFFLFVFMLIHLMTCIFLGIARYRFKIMSMMYNSTTFLKRITGRGTFANVTFLERSNLIQYLVAWFKNVQNVMLINTSDIKSASRSIINMEEQIVSIINYLVGKLLVCVIWIVMLYVFAAKWQLRTKFEEIMTELNKYMLSKQFPLELKSRIITYYEYKYQKLFFNEFVTTSLLSETLKKEIDVFLCKSLIQEISIFSQVSAKHLKHIISNLVPRIYLPGDLIIQAGTYGDCMYIIESGTVAVFSPSGKEMCHLYDNAYFGEVSLLFKKKKRSATVVAIEVSRMYELNKKEFNRCFKNKTNKKIYMSIIKLAERRLKETSVSELQMKEAKILAELKA
ncbi:potassium/sodium hyperpolarization-activated cyclic nucleotide-gated channel 3-like [Anthonomus grandis grandis]|uniref:potassium/sodium hyperpolarization-activated cyclic nucleotide-gated channel 3-like n=1 Tax=Anthonomus grandis grandis TaxID=2921223 RepID=UPI002165B5BE|nr:potassium/sodium hyperpolarization-activated cyclic nucleotide-gated channel 3-like [Anthonomus grandis grandis]